MKLHNIHKGTLNRKPTSHSQETPPPRYSEPQPRLAALSHHHQLKPDFPSSPGGSYVHGVVQQHSL